MESEKLRGRKFLKATTLTNTSMLPVPGWVCTAGKTLAKSQRGKNSGKLKAANCSRRKCHPRTRKARAGKGRKGCEIQAMMRRTTRQLKQRSSVPEGGKRSQNSKSGFSRKLQMVQICPKQILPPTNPESAGGAKSWKSLHFAARRAKFEHFGAESRSGEFAGRNLRPFRTRKARAKVLESKSMHVDGGRYCSRRLVEAANAADNLCVPGHTGRRTF